MKFCKTYIQFFKVHINDTEANYTHTTIFLLTIHSSFLRLFLMPIKRCILLDLRGVRVPPHIIYCSAFQCGRYLGGYFSQIRLQSLLQKSRRSHIWNKLLMCLNKRVYKSSKFILCQKIIYSSSEDTIAGDLARYQSNRRDCTMSSGFWVKITKFRQLIQNYQR